jgi:PAS domain S-box-containing protein
MNLYEWNDQIAQAQTMLASLEQCAQREPPEPALLQEILETLSTTVEELTVTGEELRQQQDELNAAFQQLDTERARYQDLFDAAPNAYLVTDGQGMIQEANRATETLLNSESLLLAGRLLLEFVMPEYQPQWMNLLKQITARTQVAATRLRMRRQGGNWLYDGRRDPQRASPALSGCQR